MPLNSQYAAATRTALATALAALCNGGTLKIYDGAQPANAGTAVTTQVLLATLTLPNPAFTEASGVLTLASAIADVAAVAAGTASWFRIASSGGATVCDGSVGTSAANLVLNSVAIQTGADVGVSALSITIPASGS